MKKNTNAYGVQLKTQRIDQRTNETKWFNSREDAMEYRRRMNKFISSFEHIYYGDYYILVKS